MARRRHGPSWEHSGPSIPRSARRRRQVECTLGDEALAALDWLVRHRYGAVPDSAGKPLTSRSRAIELAVLEARERADACVVAQSQDEDGSPVATITGPTPRAVAGRTYLVAAYAALASPESAPWTLEVDPTAGRVVLRLSSHDSPAVTAAITALSRAAR